MIRGVPLVVLNRVVATSSARASRDSHAVGRPGRRFHPACCAWPEFPKKIPGAALFPVSQRSQS